MLQTEDRIQAVSASSSACLEQMDDAVQPIHTKLRQKYALQNSLTLLAYRVAAIWQIWYGALRSCYWHIRSQSPTKPSFDFLGARVAWHPESKTYQPNLSAIAGSLYIKMLLATSWDQADTIDLRMFLMGFQAGEGWAYYKNNISGNAERPEVPKWLLLAEKDFGHVPDLVRQEINALKSHTSVLTPAAIAGVTHND